MALERRVMAEAVGTLMLTLALAGSGLESHHTFPNDPAFGLIASALAIASALSGLIMAFGPVSGGHFNPLITGLQWLAGERKLDCTLAYVAAQIIGAVLGALLARLLFTTSAPLENTSVQNLTLAASEFVAATGLMIVVFGCARGGRTDIGPFAVGAWLAAAILATPSASLANPAFALAAIIIPGPIGLPSETALLYLPAEVAGALLALGVVTVVYPRRRRIERSIAAPMIGSKESLE